MPGSSETEGKPKERRVRFAAGTKEDKSGDESVASKGDIGTARHPPWTGAGTSAGQGGNSSSNQELQEHLFNAIQLAQKEVSENGIVHFTEFYEGEDDTEPTRVEGLPTATDSSKGKQSFEELCDMTGSKSKPEDAEEKSEADVEGKEEEGEEETEEDIEIRRELLMEDLMHAERAFQEEEEREKEREEQNEEEAFGSGFARGFFGDGKKEAKRSQNRTKAKKAPLKAGQSVPSPKKTQEAVQETIVERKPTGRRRRTRSKAKAKAPKSVVVDVLDEDDSLVTQAGFDPNLGMFTADDDDRGEEELNKSRFKTMREKRYS